MSLYEVLKKVISDPYLHARWLNTVSYLEHIGSRKLIKCLNSRNLTLDLIQHISEEARHAYFFKKLVEKHFPGECPTYDDSYLLAGREAENYFQRLDDFVMSLLGEDGRGKVYLFVTLAVEVRALEVYKIYQRLLKQAGTKIQIMSVLNEEEKHLLETIEKLKETEDRFEELWEQVKEFEFVEYQKLLGEIQTYIQNYNGSQKDFVF